MFKYIIIIFFISCSSSRKIKTELKTVSKIDSVAVQYFDSARVVKEISQDNKELTIEYDPNQTTDTIAAINYDSDTYIRIPTKGLRKISISHKTHAVKTDSVKVTDQSFNETHAQTHADNKTETVKKNEVEVPSLGFSVWYIVAGILLPALVGLFIWWRNRKKKKPNPFFVNEV